MPPRTPLLFPGQYFAETDDPLPLALGVFALSLLTSIIVASSVIALIGTRWQYASDPFVLFEAVIHVLFTIVINLGSRLFIVAAVLYVLSGALWKNGNIVATFAVACWSYAPNAIAQLVTLALVTAEGATTNTFTNLEPAELATGTEFLSQTSSTLINVVLPLTVVLWSVYILTQGVDAANEDVPFAGAFGAALIVGCGVLLLEFV
ncbi:YIP1 family protein [Natrialba aegyptia]|uniref:YIP1 family protein n=1 Tax=Natrialba aegyptia TaxID=129789 RepID=UPI000677F4DC|nr:YIP1 family protein [Natrialba aegyptia]